MSDEEVYEEDGEFTRLRAKVQIGDGVDQRGEVSVERSSKQDEDGRGYEKTTKEVTLPEEMGGDTVEIQANNELFAEFYYELTRSTKALRQELGLPDEDEE